MTAAGMLGSARARVRTFRFARRPALVPGRLRRLRRLGVLVAVLGLAGSAGYLFWLRDSSLVGVERVSVNGVHGQNAVGIRSALRAAGRDQTTLHVDVGDLRSAVDGYPEVKDLRVSTDFPHGLRIEVVQHEAVAALTAGRARLAVAADGTLLRRQRTGGRLPVVRMAALPQGGRLEGARALRDVALLAAAPARLRPRVLRVTGGRGGLNVVLRRGPRLIFGPPVRVAAKWAAATRVLADAGSAGARYLDVRIPERPVAGGLVPDPSAPLADGEQPAVPGEQTAPGEATGPPADPSSAGVPEGAGETPAPSGETPTDAESPVPEG